MIELTEQELDICSIPKEIVEKFPLIAVLDLDDPNIQKEIVDLEEKAYSGSNYGDRVEGEGFFDRIKEQEFSNFSLGIRDSEGNLVYFMNIGVIPEGEKVFDDTAVTYPEDYPLNETQGLVFNKIIKDPNSEFENNLPSRVQLFIIGKLLQLTKKAIRIEEQCQPDSYRFFVAAEARSLMQIWEDRNVQHSNGEINFGDPITEQMRKEMKKRGDNMVHLVLATIPFNNNTLIFTGV